MIRNVPIVSINYNTLRVSVNFEQKRFYISPGLIFVGGESFIFKGGEGILLPPPCRIGIEVKGDFIRKYNFNWMKHGDPILYQAFVKAFPVGYQKTEEQELEDRKNRNNSIRRLENTISRLEKEKQTLLNELGFKIAELENSILEADEKKLQILIEKRYYSLLLRIKENRIRSSEESIREAKAEELCEQLKKEETIKDIEEPYPNTEEKIRFDLPKEILTIPKCLPFKEEEELSNFKLLATIVDKKVNQHRYGPISFFPWDSYKDAKYIPCISRLTDNYTIKPIASDIFLL